MSASLIILTAVVYLLLLFFIAAYLGSERGKKLVNNPYTYALSLGVFCTAWTFYGSVGRAATDGVGFLPVYIGPTLLAPLWFIILRKIILVSHQQRSTSIADFISSRYGKSTTLGAMTALISLFAIIPYISIQLKAVANSYYLLKGESSPYDGIRNLPLHLDSAFYLSIALAVFIILFGTRKLDPNEKHEGLIGVIAFESILKLVAFLAVGLFVSFGLYNGFQDMFTQAINHSELQKLFTFSSENLQGYQWFWLNLLAMFAVLLLPRQFHVAVVENTDADFTRKATWAFPLYLFLINIFVIPIAVGGLLQFTDGSVAPDTFVLSLPLTEGKRFLALFVALGGFSAATSMVIVSVIALSIMLSNNLVLPLLLRSTLFASSYSGDLTKSLLMIRRGSIILIILLSYFYFRSIGQTFSLVSIGLISFVGIAQFAPSLILGLYWKGATKKGAMTGLILGFLIWSFTLALPSLIGTNTTGFTLMEEGLFGLSYLKPYELFGMSEANPIVHAAFWSLLFNTMTFVFVSLYTKPDAVELSQADLFVDIYKYHTDQELQNLRKRKAKISDIRRLLVRFLGEFKTKEIFNYYEKRNYLNLKEQEYGRTDLVNLAEKHLAGAIGAASAKVLIGTVTKEEPISLEEMFVVLEQTQEIIRYSKALERKSKELEATTNQLRAANEQLKELERLKADFITTVTHELRTPITSIKSIAKILSDHHDLESTQQEEFLKVLVLESERISRLINQVLDLEKIQSPKATQFEPIEFCKVVNTAFTSLQVLANEKGIDYQWYEKVKFPLVLGNADHL
ncbi:MAG: sensor histidine kinase, partial [Bacteroidota bacterium]